jgi:TRAP-type C4-dicarboxylate transport system permease small subunit
MPTWLEKIMRALLVACLAIVIVALGAAAVLDRYALSSSTAFTEPTARL